MANDHPHGRDRSPRRCSRRDADLGGESTPDREQAEWEREAHPGGSDDPDKGLGFQKPDWSKSEFEKGDRRSSGEGESHGDRSGNDFERF